MVGGPGTASSSWMESKRDGTHDDDASVRNSKLGDL